MSVNLNTEVFVLIGTTVHDARIHQTCAYNVFMSHDINEMHFKAGPGINFRIKKETPTCGFKSHKYPNWCVFITETGEEYILSPDKRQLELWNAYVKRMTQYGGKGSYVTKRKRSRRNLKRKTMKRKSKK